MNSKIFISYRRDDSLVSTGRLYDRLKAHFGAESIFMDIDTIEPGLDFVDAIDQAVSSCDLHIAVIGPRWSTASGEKSHHRLDDPEDFVRLEIAAALRRGIRLIPASVEGASMPRASDLPDNLTSLVRRNATELSYARFDADVDRLIRSVERAH
jgi:hypothetical protein